LLRYRVWKVRVASLPVRGGRFVFGMNQGGERPPGELAWRPTEALLKGRVDPNKASLDAPDAEQVEREVEEALEIA
jgi:hypothetical protein